MSTSLAWPRSHQSSVIIERNGRKGVFQDSSKFKKFASRCQIASGLYGPLRSRHTGRDSTARRDFLVFES